MPSPLSANKLLTNVIIAIVVLIIAAAVCSLIGPEKLSFSNAISPTDTVNPDFEIFFKIRLPRILLAAIVGAALAASGTVFQALLRNPLAEPYILGISSGAGLGVILAAILPFSALIPFGYANSIFAFIGAIVTVWLVWIIGRITGRTNITGLLLAGIVVNAFLSASIMFLTSISKSNQIFSTIFWLMGNIQEHPPLVLWTGTGFIIAGIAALYFIAPQLNAMSFSEDDARTMGINPIVTQAISYAVTALITAIAVSLSGLIGFVGLIVPHAVRMIFGPDHRQLILLSAIYGGVLLIIADTFARVIVAPAQLPVGVVTALIGGPFFLLLLIKSSRKAN